MRRVVIVLGILALVAVASAQELRAWMDLEFGDSPEAVQAKLVKMDEEGRFELGESWLGDWYTNDPTIRMYDVTLAGVETKLQFDFYDNKLYRVRFTTEERNASYWDSTIVPEAAVLRQVMRAAYGAPDRTYSVSFLQLRNGYVNWTDVWASGGVSRYVGLGERQSRFYAQLRIEWDWMVGFIASVEAQEQDQSIQDASQGF